MLLTTPSETKKELEKTRADLSKTVDLLSTNLNGSPNITIKLTFM
jgi:hypothetical protein